MNRFSNFLFAMLLLFMIELKAQNKNKIHELIQHTANNLEQNKIISYTIDNLFFTVGDLDTAYTRINVYNSKDATYIYSKRFKCFDNYVIFEDSVSSQYSVNNCNKTFDTIVHYTPHYAGFCNVFQSGIQRFNAKYIRSNYLDSNAVIYESIQKTLLGKIPCYKINILLPDMGNMFTEGFTILYITEDYRLLKIEEGAKLNGENSYYSFEIKEFNLKETDIRGKINQIEKSYTLIPYKTNEMNDSLKNILQSNAITEITGKKIGENDSSIISLKSKVFLIDFWYMACYGCMLSYPVIDSINNLYKTNSNFNLTSFNLIDTDSRLLKRVINYLVKNHITNNSYFGAKGMSKELFGENGFPLFVVIDDTKIKYVQLGYNENLFQNLKNVIDESLLKYKK